MRHLIFLVVSFLLVGCEILHTIDDFNLKAGTVNFETGSRPPRTIGYPIDVFEKDQVKVHYKVIGVVRSYSLDRMRVSARRLGGDALIDFREVIVPQEDKMTTTFEAKIIVFEE